MSDNLTDANDLTLHVSLIDFEGEVIKSIDTKVDAKANASEKVYTIAVKEFATAKQQQNSVVNAVLTDGKGEVIAQSNYFFHWPNKLNLPKTTINKSVSYNEGEYKVTLESDYLAKDVFVEIPIQGALFSDNFFDLLPGEKKVVTITSPELTKRDKTAITVKHLRETYKPEFDYQNKDN